MIDTNISTVLSPPSAFLNKYDISVHPPLGLPCGFKKKSEPIHNHLNFGIHELQSKFATLIISKMYILRRSVEIMCPSIRRIYVPFYQCRLCLI